MPSRIFASHEEYKVLRFCSKIREANHACFAQDAGATEAARWTFRYFSTLRN
jgi:hypothetical protein